MGVRPQHPAHGRLRVVRVACLQPRHLLLSTEDAFRVEEMQAARTAFDAKRRVAVLGLQRNEVHLDGETRHDLLVLHAQVAGLVRVFLPQLVRVLVLRGFAVHLCVLSVVLVHVCERVAVVAVDRHFVLARASFRVDHERVRVPPERLPCSSGLGHGFLHVLRQLLSRRLARRLGHWRRLLDPVPRNLVLAGQQRVDVLRDHVLDLHQVLLACLLHRRRDDHTSLAVFRSWIEPPFDEINFRRLLSSPHQAVQNLRVLAGLQLRPASVHTHAPDVAVQSAALVQIVAQ
mmetsp:Transcript_27068/g.68234  ORF Transcript_27068/g.68234 Transcript_27068/m.68234 type:complete len:288 (-) Transcript_27068:1106-1969(-)